MKAKFTFLVLLLAAGLAAAAESKPVPAAGPVVVLPTLVVIGHQIPRNWLEVSWECMTAMPFSPVKRAWISKVGWGTPADKAGIRRGDRLLAVGGMEVARMGGETLHSLLQLEHDAGTILEFTLQTPGHEKRSVAIRFEQAPEK